MQRITQIFRKVKEWIGTWKAIILELYLFVAKCKKKEKKVKAIQDVLNKYEYYKLKFSHATG